MRSRWMGSTTAPMSMALSSGSPTRKDDSRVLILSMQRSAMPSSINRREPAQHTSPWLNQMASTRPSTALSRSASSNTKNGDLPPSSRVSFLPVPAVARRIRRPTSVEPVNATLATSGWSTSRAPVSPAPVTMLTTPGGRPASRTSSAK